MADTQYKMDSIQESSTKISGPVIKVVEISGKRVEIKKLGLISYTTLMSSMKSLIASVAQLAITDWAVLLNGTEGNELDYTNSDTVKVTADTVAEVLIKILTENVEKLIEFLGICVPNLEREFIENEVGLPDVFTIIDAVLEVNGILDFTARIKNLMGETPMMRR